MQINAPLGLVGCRCGASGEVCVKGSDAFFDTQLAFKVHGKIYVPPNQPVNPIDGPPADASWCVPNADGTWCLGFLSGASCQAAQPYAKNVIWVWGEYIEDDGNHLFTADGQPFKGQCQANLPTCCGESSSGSSGSSSGISGSSSGSSGPSGSSGSSSGGGTSSGSSSGM